MCIRDRTSSRTKLIFNKNLNSGISLQLSRWCCRPPKNRKLHHRLTFDVTTLKYLTYCNTSNLFLYRGHVSTNSLLAFSILSIETCKVYKFCRNYKGVISQYIRSAHIWMIRIFVLTLQIYDRTIWRIRLQGPSIHFSLLFCARECKHLRNRTLCYDSLVPYSG